MGKRKLFALMIVTGLTGAGAVVVPAQGASPKLSIDQARRIALEAAHGRILSEEYEEENGAWRYSFDVLEGGRIHEIGVDANTGAIVEDAWENLGEKESASKDEKQSESAPR